MPRPEPAGVWVEVRLGCDPIEGIVHAHDERESPFAGWLQLVAVLQAVIERAAGDQ